ncbi:hypothetical protein T4A_13924 [Trichinella pseudospiralis]|uniref:histone acetyltransferase n=1 Tax=Trichinella pseudospiralis TaxID=6337 RepID=A0A0V1DRS0_TRIPS|nr:hypothetical protein T4A_13924 [Trichinella pseudospiralis]KRZ35556.1 hypothetical protein T4C_13664 [Trichinella pseudospiralis]
MCTKMKTVQEHFLNTLKALKPTENAEINACVFIITHQFLKIRYLLWPEMPTIYNLSCIMAMFYRKKKIIYARRRQFSVEGLAAYRHYWLQSIVEYMAQKGTKRQFDTTELPKLSGIADVDIAATLFTYDMLAKEHEEYWIVISEV